MKPTWACICLLIKWSFTMRNTVRCWFTMDGHCHPTKDAAKFYARNQDPPIDLDVMGPFHILVGNKTTLINYVNDDQLPFPIE